MFAIERVGEGCFKFDHWQGMVDWYVRTLRPELVQTAGQRRVGDPT